MRPLLPLLAAAALAVPLAAAAPARAASCDGTLYAGLLGKLPRTLNVGLLVHDDSAQNLGLAERFKEGLASAGVNVQGVPTAQLSISATFFGATNDFDTNRPVSPEGRTSTFEWGPSRQTAGQTRLGYRRDPASAPQQLALRADLRAAGETRVAWTATIRCTVQTGDMAQLAYDLGAALGPAIGKSVPTRHL
jgi:hypothetical protein